MDKKIRIFLCNLLIVIVVWFLSKDSAYDDGEIFIKISHIVSIVSFMVLASIICSAS